MTVKFQPNVVIELDDGFVPMPILKTIISSETWDNVFDGMVDAIMEDEGLSRRPFRPEDIAWIIKDIANDFDYPEYAVVRSPFMPVFSSRLENPQKYLDEKLTKKAREYITPEGFTEKGWKYWKKGLLSARKDLEKDVAEQIKLEERAKKYIEASKKANKEKIKSDECFTDIEWEWDDREIFENVYPKREISKQLCRAPDETGKWKTGVKYGRLKQLSKKGVKGGKYGGEKYDNEKRVLKELQRFRGHYDKKVMQFDRAVTGDLIKESEEKLQTHFRLLNETERYFHIIECGDIIDELVKAEDVPDSIEIVYPPMNGGIPALSLVGDSNLCKSEPLWYRDGRFAEPIGKGWLGKIGNTPVPPEKNKQLLSML